ncbi:hypothetical protein CC78DRAFT_529111 [Lojkania enalia]|uniref:Zn(2)-C6 fungal-type domain-containing protein n=1 Tax=Lojkania enalia TaxID=147567 RepID=A0A9P4NB20_9PLEO|nr:hypothetical protein CC78DRAFT_529111 [Didymosphaeria enalia]
MIRGSTSTQDQAPKKVPEQQLNRACEACRLSKVRCLMSPIPGSTQCQRCVRVGRACVFAPPAKRKQRKRTDVRVAELEREVKQMRSLLKSNQISPGESSDHDHEPMAEEAEEQEEHHEDESPVDGLSHEKMITPGTQSSDWADDVKRGASRPDRMAWTNSDGQISPYIRLDGGPKDSFSQTDLDIIDRGIISQDMAEELLDIYRKDLVQACPGVVIPNDWTASQLRAKKPALFHAVMAAASHSKGAGLANRLHEEVIYLYAKSLFIKGEKSIQQIQALLVTVAYYTPPNTPAQLQIFQYANMAAGMALELGLATKPRTHEQLPKRAIRSLQRISSAEELLENCRTILTLYILTAGFSMRLRRPNMLLYNSWMEECLALLQKSPLIDDKRLVAWLKLQRIADEANTASGFDDASTSFSLSELRLQVILRVFERRMLDWQKSIPQEVMSLSMMIEYHQNMLSMWEFAMDGGRYDAPDYRNRHLSLPALDDDSIQPESLLSRSALQINATIKCISAAHSLLDCFLQLSIERLQKAPNVLFVRSIYSLVALMKADYAVTTDAEGLGEVLDSQSLRVDFYLETVIRKAEEAIGPQKCRIPSHWFHILNLKLKTWYDEYKQWRKDGRYLKRNIQQKMEGQDGTTPATQAPSSALDDIKPSGTQQVSILPSAIPEVSNYNTNNTYPTWPASALTIPSTDASQSFPTDQQAFTTEMGDFSGAFQHGDLYLWNDINDGFGGWIPQSGSIYSDLQFGGFNGQGM